MLSNQQNAIDAAIVLGIVSDLCILAPDYLTRLGDESQLGDIDFDYSTFGYDA